MMVGGDSCFKKDQVSGIARSRSHGLLEIFRLCYYADVVSHRQYLANTNAIDGLSVSNDDANGRRLFRSGRVGGSLAHTANLVARIAQSDIRRSLRLLTCVRLRPCSGSPDLCN